MQLAQQTPQIYNMPLLHRQMLEVLGIKNAAKLIPMDEDQKPTDPVSENQHILMMKPVKAFEYQDHQAHITVHMAAMQDPKIQQLLQGNPMAQQLQQAMMAHINEHLGFAYRVQIEQQLGMALPTTKDESGDEVGLNPQVEAQLAPMLAQAAQQLLQQNQQQAAQQQAQQQMQDPIIQMQQQELQLKAQDLQRKTQKDQVDAALKEQQLKNDMLKTAAQMSATKQQNTMNLGVDVMKHLSDKNTHKQDQSQQMLQAVMSARQQMNKPTKGNK
jgi:hypothetical protein